MKVLVYTQDVGGTKCLMPVIKTAPEDFPGHSFVFFRHPLSRAVFGEHAFTPRPFFDIDDLPVGVARWRDILRETATRFVLCTLSSPQCDATNANLIVAARDLGITSLGIMDHWKGFDRFYDDAGNPRFFTDWMGCIDEPSRLEFVRHGVQPEKIGVVGHPGLEQHVTTACFLSQNVRPRVLIVSQPDTVSRSFSSIFLRQWRGRQLLAEILEHLKGVLPVCVSLRRHPKEVSGPSLPLGVELEGSASSEAALARHDIIIGLDSSVMIEACLMGRATVVMDLPVFSDLTRERLPYVYGRRVTDLDGFDRAIADWRDSAAFGAPTTLKTVLAGSRDRAQKFLRECFARG